MGKISIPDNYVAICDESEFVFYAVSDAQAWYVAVEHFEFEFVDEVWEIDEYGNRIRQVFHG